MTIYISGSELLSWEDARAKVRGDLWRPGNGISDDVIDRALHASLLDLEAEERWLWLENITGGLSFTTAADSIAIPATVQSISALAYRQGNAVEPLTVSPLRTVRSMSPGSNGLPSFYALGDGIIYFDTICPSGLQLEMIFSASTPEYVSDAIAADNPTLARHQQAVLACTCARIALGFLKDSEGAARFQAVYERDLERLRNRENQQRADESGGCVQPDDTYAVAAFGYGGR